MGMFIPTRSLAHSLIGPGFKPRPSYLSIVGLLEDKFPGWEDLPVFSFKCVRQKFVKFRSTLRIFTVTRAGGQMGWPGTGMPWTLIFPWSATLSCRQQGHALLTVLRLSNNQIYSRSMVRQGQSNIYCTKSLISFSSAPLYTVHINPSGLHTGSQSHVKASALTCTKRLTPP